MLNAPPHHDIATRTMSLEVRLSRVRRRASELKAELKAKKHELACIASELRAQGVVINELSPEELAQAETRIERILEDCLR